MNNMQPGDRYLRSLGLRPAQDSDALAAQLRQAVGDAQAEAALSALYTRRAQQETATSGLDRQETAAFYDLKNQHPQASLILSAAHDWDLLCQTCQWVTQHPDAFGATILDVGCDCGLLSCFLAQTFPHSRITSIDRSANGIHAAQQLAERLGLTNITFLHADLETLPPMEFDTVFSSRTVQENYDPLLENARFLQLTHQGRICAQVFQRYTGLLCQFVKSGGTFVTIERMERDRVFLGYCLALHSQGLDLIPESHQELHCQEGDHTTVLQAFCGIKEGRTTTTDAEDFFIATFQDALTWQPRHLDVEGELILELCAEELIRGHFLHNPQGARVGKLAIYTSKFDPEELFYYQGILGQPVQVHRLSRGELSDVLALLETDLATLTASTLSAHPFSFQDGVELLLPLEESEED